jgi:hypothetical protein
MIIYSVTNKINTKSQLLARQQTVYEISEIEKNDRNGTNEHIEYFEVFATDAFGYPRAVVVVPLDTYIAPITVMNPSWFEHFASLAVPKSCQSYLTFGSSFSSSSYMPGLLKAVTMKLKGGIIAKI